MIVTSRESSRNLNGLGHIFVHTHKTKEAMVRINDLIRHGHDAEYCRLLPITGVPRCGKTSLVAAFDRMSDAAKGDFQPRKLLEVQVPPKPGRMDLVTATLYALNDPMPERGRIQEKMSRAYRLLKRGSYDAVVFDEVHRVLDGAADKSGKTAAQWISDLLNMRICPVIGIGEPAFLNMLKTNFYVDGRTLGNLQITPCDWSDIDQRQAFRLMIQGICENMGMPGQLDLSDRRTAKRLWDFSEGRIGYVALLLTQARILAQREGAPSIDEDCLRRSADILALQGTSLDHNPFGDDKG